MTSNMTKGLDSFEEFNKLRDWDKPTKPEQLTKDFIDKILAETPDNDLVFKFQDCVTGILQDNYSNEFDVVMSLPDGFITIWITSGVDAEVNNGGYNQYFFNSAGQFTNAAPHAFKLLGADELSKIHEEANKLIGANSDALRNSWKENTMEAFMDSYKEKIFEDLDNKYYKSNVNLYDLQAKYIRRNPEKFVFVAKK